MRSSPFRRRRLRALIVSLTLLIKRMWFARRQQAGNQLHHARGLGSSTSMFGPEKAGIRPRARRSLKHVTLVENRQWLRPALNTAGSPERWERSTKELDPCRLFPRCAHTLAR